MRTPANHATIKVLVHVMTDGRCAIGILESEWQGARRLDRRLGAARPVAYRLSGAPRGVSAPVWMAYCALRDEIDRQEQAAADRAW